MIVEPADDDGFTMDVSRGDGLTIKATVRLAKGRPVCRALVLSTERGQIDRDVLHTIGLATLLRQAALAAVAPVGRIPLGKPPGLTDEHLAKVTAAYRQASRNHENTATAVRRLGRDRVEQGYRDAPVSTARRWVGAARERGFLKQTTQGRKGG
jgi:hypothetical protein